MKISKKKFFEYCKYSSAAGIKYVGEPKRSFCERSLWSIVILVTVYICSILIQGIWEKWSRTPVVVSFSSNLSNITEVPFPAITICSDAKSSKKIFDFGDSLKHYLSELANEKEDFLEVLSQVCDVNTTNIFQSHIFETEIAEYSVKDILAKLENKEFSDGDCRFWDKKRDCKELFDKIITDKGICNSFNLLRLSDIFRDEVEIDEMIIREASDGNHSTTWTLGKGFKDDYESFPFRTYNAFRTDGFIVALYDDANDVDGACSDGDEGFKFVITSPGDMPSFSSQFYSVPYEQEILVDIMPDVTETTGNAIYYDSKIRGCYFEEERYLRFFRLYTQSNCELECLANFTLKECGCVRFNLPHSKGTPICGGKKIACYEHAKAKMLRKNFYSYNKELKKFRPSKYEENKNKENGKDEIIQANCNCLPDCNSLSYGVRIAQSKLSKQTTEMFKRMGFRATRFTFFFRDTKFWKKDRSELYGTIDFIADAGGLLGLFMGVSLLSFVEIFYFCCLRKYDTEDV